jgi:hypothetical protein
MAREKWYFTMETAKLSGCWYIIVVFNIFGDIENNCV